MRVALKVNFTYQSSLTFSCSEQLYSILNSKEKLERLRSNKKNAFNIKSIVLELKSQNRFQFNQQAKLNLELSFRSLYMQYLDILQQTTPNTIFLLKCPIINIMLTSIFSNILCIRCILNLSDVLLPLSNTCRRYSREFFAYFNKYINLF